MKLNLGTLFSSLFLLTVVTMTRRTETGVGATRWTTNVDFVLPTQPLMKAVGQSYLLYHLHCRIAEDCCLTSTLLVL